MFRCLYDYTYECNIYEAFVFWFCYFIFEFYISINVALFIYFILLGGNFSITTPRGYTFGLGLIIFAILFGATIIPLILNSIITICIAIKKRAKLKKYPYIIFFITLILISTCFLPTFLGIMIGLIPPIFLMQKDDYSLEKEVLAMEKENLEQKLKVERLLANEQLSNIKLKQLEKRESSD